MAQPPAPPADPDIRAAARDLLAAFAALTPARDDQGRTLVYCGGGMTDIDSHHGPHQTPRNPGTYCTGDPDTERGPRAAYALVAQTAGPALARHVLGPGGPAYTFLDRGDGTGDQTAAVGPFPTEQAALDAADGREVTVLWTPDDHAAHDRDHDGPA